MRRALTNLLVIGCLVASVEAAPRANTHPESPRSKSKTPAGNQATGQRPYQIGKASWYGKLFHGKTTASGEPYDMFQFTAAHRSLPLGTYLRVTNLENGRAVVVRVNDRGPVPRSRIIDLSYGAALMLGLRSAGVETVRLDVVQPQDVAYVRQQVAGMP